LVKDMKGQPKSLLILAAVLLLSSMASRARAQIGAKFTISSPAFAPNGPIPEQYTCKNPHAGSPPLRWSGAPVDTSTFALIVKDPDAPRGTFIHWVIYNIPLAAGGLQPNVPRKPKLASGALQGDNTAGKIGYMALCPPPGPAHHYHFELMAIDTKLDLAPGATVKDLEVAIRGHVKGKAELVGTFGR
jgi:Raf kinase inhibitor-like YbhB/YbcL family protein